MSYQSDMADLELTLYKTISGLDFQWGLAFSLWESSVRDLHRAGTELFFNTSYWKG